MEKWIKKYRLGRSRQVAIWISVTLIFWRSELSNLSLVVLDKLIWKKFQRKVLTEIHYSYWILNCYYNFSYSKYLEKWIKQYKLGRIRQVVIWISVSLTSWKSESSNVSLVVLDKVLLVTLSSWRSESSNLSLVVLDKLIWKKFQRKVLIEINYSYWILNCYLYISNSNF